MVLYYGSATLFTKPTFGVGNSSNDYGRGFYMTPDKKIADLWASKFPHGGYNLKFKIDLNKLRILYLNTATEKDVISWITLLVTHRFDKDEYEKSKETIVREAKEELDIDINPNELKFMTKFKTGNVWIDTYILKCDYDVSKMKFQEEN